MIPRTLEPEVMDSDAEALTYDHMDHRDVNARFVSDLLAVAPYAARSTWAQARRSSRSSSSRARGIAS
jgi:hypothetical protein